MIGSHCVSAAKSAFITNTRGFLVGMHLKHVLIMHLHLTGLSWHLQVLKPDRDTLTFRRCHGGYFLHPEDKILKFALGLQTNGLPLQKNILDAFDCK